jgi:ElaB/YqjD/DUF883 family membrane-anchored ribosome-binding protein
MPNPNQSVGRSGVSEAQQAFDPIKDSISDAGSSLKETVSAAAIDAKTKATAAASDALALVESKWPWLKTVADNAADRVEQISEDVRDAAQRRPIAFLAVGALAGLVVGHFIRGMGRSA